MALELSLKGKGGVNPNPLVGAVIVKDGHVIGEGYHAKYGENHAEINAFESAKESVEGACMYVTLEPCSHYGNTPPCAKAIIEKGISRVVIGLMDPNPLVAGRGRDMLIEQGIEVVTGVLEDELKYVNRVFLKYILSNEPWVVSKSAMTLDGKIAAHTGDSKWVSGEASRAIVHEMRNELLGIMVGVNTIIADDPTLNTRLADGRVGRDPIRIVLDSNLRIPINCKVLENPNNLWIVCGPSAKLEARQKLISKGARILEVPLKHELIDLKALMAILGENKVDGVLLEGGGTLNFSAIQAGIVDEVCMFIAPKLVGGVNALTPFEGEGFDLMADAIQLDDIKYMQVGQDLMVRALVNKDI